MATRSGKAKVATTNGKAKVTTKNGRTEVATKSGKAKVVAMTIHLKWEPKMRRQSGNLKVSFVPFFHFFGLFSCMVLLEQRRR